MDPVVQLILSALLGLFGMATLALLAWSLKVQVDTRAELAGLREWRKHVDNRLERHAQLLGDGDKRMDKISDRIPKKTGSNVETGPVHPLRPKRRQA